MMNNENQEELMQDAWQHTKENEGKYRTTVSVVRNGVHTMNMRFIPLRKINEWSDGEKNWFYEMEDRYGEYSKDE